jgi:hypothetical protein
VKDDMGDKFEVKLEDEPFDELNTSLRKIRRMSWRTN